MKRSLSIAAVLFLTTTAHVALADSDSAKKYFEAGAAAYGRGEFREAAEAFERSHHDVPHAATLMNAARAWREAGELARAADDFAAATAIPDITPADAEEANKKLTELRASVGTVDLRGPKGALVAVGHVAALPVPTTVHLAPGEHDIQVTYDGGATATVRVTARAGARIEAVVPEPPSKPPPPPPPPPPSDPGKAQRIGGIVTMASSSLFVGAAIGMGVAALDARDTYEASNFSDTAAYDRAAALRIGTNVAWATAGVVAITGLVVTLTAPRSSPSPVAVSIGAGYARVDVPLW